MQRDVSWPAPPPREPARKLPGARYDPARRTPWLDDLRCYGSDLIKRSDLVSPVTPGRILFLIVSASHLNNMIKTIHTLVFSSRQTNDDCWLCPGCRQASHAHHVLPTARDSSPSTLAHQSPGVMSSRRAVDSLVIFAMLLRMNDHGLSKWRKQIMNLCKSLNLWPYQADAVTWSRDCFIFDNILLCLLGRLSNRSGVLTRPCWHWLCDSNIYL